MQPRRLLFALDIVVRLAIVYWLAEAWVLRDDPRFAQKAIPERNTVIVGALSLLLPALWIRERPPRPAFPVELDLVYLSIFALDMAGNSFDLYERYRYFDLVPHFHSTGAFSLVVAVWWASRARAGGEARPRTVLETTLAAAGIATMVHVALEAQEYYTDVLAGTVNVGGVADTVNDLAVGLIGALLYGGLGAAWSRRRSA